LPFLPFLFPLRLSLKEAYFVNVLASGSTSANFFHKTPAGGVPDRKAMMELSELVLTDRQLDAAPDSVMDAGVAARLSFDQAFEAHYRRVYRYAYALTCDRGLAEDVVQEVFLRLYQNIDAAQRDGLLRAWLLRVTANVSRNMLRGLSRARSRDETFVAQTARMTEAALPDGQLAREAEIAETRRVLDKIKEPMRSCLLLRHEGLSYKEIAAALGVKESSVGGFIARARREFVRMYGKIEKL
jgi:RNA polymerase sigma factor (sigma-70 family)